MSAHLLKKLPIAAAFLAASCAMLPHGMQPAKEATAEMAPAPAPVPVQSKAPNPPPAQQSEPRLYTGTGTFVNTAPMKTPPAPGPQEASLNFEAVDVREVAKVILADLLHASYTVHPAVTGSVTFRTIRPIAIADLLPTLEMLLRQNNAAVVLEGDIYKVVPISAVRGSVSPQLGGVNRPLPPGFSVVAIPLKYEGLSYTEIWISEAQERMVLAVPNENWPAFEALCKSEGVEATAIGRFVPSGRLTLKYNDHQVADLSMEFLHGGRPPVVREAEYAPPAPRAFEWGASAGDPLATLEKILGSLNVASKHWVIRQYDHEVQGGSVVKPLVGAANDGPSDAAVLRPVLSSRRGIVVACGMNPHYADFDTYHMAASAIDEAVRNCVAVGADPARIAILDNFCWGNTDRPQTLGSLVRAALACQEVAIALGTPFISGKDSLNNEFRTLDAQGSARSIAIPPSLLISALGQIDDVARCVTMDFKQPDGAIYLIGLTRRELGGSHFALVRGLSGGQVPTVDPAAARRTFAALHRAMAAGLVRACHDLSEGGLAVALAEMAFAGGLGATIEIDAVPCQFDEQNFASPQQRHAALLFAESNSRFLCEVAASDVDAFERQLAEVPHARLGQVIERPSLVVAAGGRQLFSADVYALKAAWQKPLDWN